MWSNWWLRDCDNGKNVTVRSKSTYNHGRLSKHENVTMVRMLKLEVKVHTTLEDLFTWKCDSGKNGKVRSKST